MRRSMYALLAMGVASAAVVAAPNALAYDKQAYSYAATHMVEVKDIPKGLGEYRPGLFFSASAGKQEIYLCSNNDKPVSISGPRMSFNANYSPKKGNSNSAGVTIYQFASSTAAIKAFRALEREAKKCTGTKGDSSTADDEVTYSWSSTLTNGKVPGVTIVGVESIFINSDYIGGSSDQDEKSLSDSYTVYSLVNDAIVSTSFYANNASSLTKAQRNAANQFAFNAVGAWVG